MDKLIFLPRALAAKYRPYARSALIAIHDKSEKPIEPQPGWSAVLHLRFHDTEGGQMGLECFDAAHAAAIQAFAETHQDCQELVVHCQMGQSRSAAVARYLSEKYAVPCFKVGTRVDWASLKVYNRRVYGTLMQLDREPLLIGLPLKKHPQ